MLGGSGIALINDDVCAIAPSDCIVCKVADAHAFRAGDDGLDLLAFGEGMDAPYTDFPRTQVVGNHPSSKQPSAACATVKSKQASPGLRRLGAGGLRVQDAKSGHSCYS